MARLPKLMSALVLSTAFTSLPMTAGAQTVSDAPISAPTIQQETTLNLTGVGKSEKEPDIATINLGVQIDGDTASDAMKQQAGVMNEVFAALKKAGIDAKDMQTGNISLNPRYNYSSRGEKPPELIGYQVSNTVAITVRDITKLGRTLDAVVEAGGNTINSVQFGLDDPSEALKAARQAAVKDALEKANLYAEAAGYKVARIITMNEAGNHTPYPQPVMMEARMMKSDSAPTPIAAGEVSYSASMTVAFELVKQ